MNINVNGINLYYEKHGSGQPLIMLHGNGESHRIFDRAVKLLEKEFEVYAIDTRGHGESSKVAEFHYDDMCEDVAGFIEALELEKPIVYGFSDGGIIALLLAMKYHNNISQIIVSGANLYPNCLRKSFLYLFKTIYKLTGSPTFKLMVTEPNIQLSDLNKINIPVAVLAGSRDMVKKSHTLEIANNIPNGTLKILKGYSHGGYIVNNETIASLIIDAVKQKQTDIV